MLQTHRATADGPGARVHRGSRAGGHAMMTTRERIRVALRGGMPDRIPWAPRWELWFNAVSRDGRLPDRYRGWHMFDVARDLGLGIKGINTPFYRFRRSGYEVQSEQRREPEGQYTITRYTTPLGEVQQVHFVTASLHAQGIGGRIHEPYIKRQQDYDVVRYIVEHTRPVAAYDTADEQLRAIGDDGFAFGPLLSCPMHRFMREWTTYEQSYLELFDYPNEVERLVEAIEAQEWELIRLAIESPLEMFGLDGNYDAELTPPPFYRRYFLPFHQRATQALHAGGKIVSTHVDGDNSGLLELIKQSGFDVGEAWTPAPMTPLTTADARRVWGSQISFWGGLATTILSESCPEREFERWFARLLLDVAPGNGLALGTGDNIPTDSSGERIARVTQHAEQDGALPLDVPALEALAAE
jgi:hypothetical protein